MLAKIHIHSCVLVIAVDLDSNLLSELRTRYAFGERALLLPVIGSLPLWLCRKSQPVDEPQRARARTTQPGPSGVGAATFTATEVASAVRRLILVMVEGPGATRNGRKVFAGGRPGLGRHPCAGRGGGRFAASPRRGAGRVEARGGVHGGKGASGLVAPRGNTARDARRRRTCSVEARRPRCR